MAIFATRRALCQVALAALAAALPARAAVRCPKPPRMVLKVGRRRQRGQIGTYCWAEGDDGCCVDMAGEVYPADALPAAPGEAPELDFAALGPAQTLSCTIRSARAAAGADGRSGIGEAGAKPVREFEIKAPASPIRLPADLPQGQYLIGVFVAAEGWGDTWQGFRLAVGSEPAGAPAAAATPVAATPAAGATPGPAAAPVQR